MVSGTFHSMWKWELWNIRLVSILPAVLLTTRMPPATVHFAGCERSLAETHSSKFFPSKRTIASDGGLPHSAAGVTTFGSGCQTSVSSGLAWDCWEWREIDITVKIASAKNFDIGMRIMLKRIHRN